jgi:Rad51
MTISHSYISPSSSGAGKTQLALQFSLFVQAPKESGGLAGSACYLTTSSKLPTARLLQISQSHELLLPSFCSLEEVHTISIPTSDFLQHVLTTILPSFIQKQGTIQGKKPVKLVVIDALAELFHGIGKTTTSTLVERKQSIARISASLHEIASSYNVAMVVLNEVVDNFDHHGYLGSRVPGEMTYKQQSRGLEGFDEKKKAALGPAWTNQVNAKIMLSRTGRRKQLQDEDFSPKRRQLLESSDNQHQSSRTSLDQEPTLIRRLRVIFSSVSAPASLDFIVSECGISVLQDNAQTVLTSDQTSSTTSKQGPDDQRPADIQLETTSARVAAHQTNEAVAAEVEDEYDKLWTEDTYNDFDWDALEQVLTQTG